MTKRPSFTFSWALVRCLLLIASVGLVTCQSQKQTAVGTRFSSLDTIASGVSFSNDIIENDTLNYFTFPYLYMGGGVAVGDVNNDGLSDIFLTGNMMPNRLYLNQGNHQFTDITETAGIAGDDRWYTGATMADVNGDGWLDIYVCVAGKYTTTQNQLYINNRDNTFGEQAAEYGLNDASPSIQATFFDYNNDGYLDIYVANYPTIRVSQGNTAYRMLMQRNDWKDSGHLYRNDGQGNYQDVTQAAGVQKFGLTLGIVATDFNQDGNTDLYVSNDFNVPDYLYLNQGDGTFSEQLAQATNHTSMFGMGVDAADFNNDGWPDLLQVDMTPEDYQRAKTNMASMSPESFYEAVDMGFHYQYMQNSLQLNNGTDQANIPHFSDISRVAGVATTDWSWGALMADLDNDGYKDVLVTNGMKRDVNNNDANAQINASKLAQEIEALSIEILPSEPIRNYAFRNQGDLTFQSVAEEWGLDHEGFSNGIAYADLDNDGDLDVVINNLNEPASLFINQTDTNQRRYLTVRLSGDVPNVFGLGSRVTIHANGEQQTQELTLTRGFQSSVAPILHFGVGGTRTIDSLEVIWPDGRYQRLKNVATNQALTLSYQESAPKQSEVVAASTPMFQEITSERGISFVHQEDLYDDFRYEPLLPHKNSQQGPGLAVGDVNGDSLDDFFIGGAARYPGVLYVQTSEGTFVPTNGPWQEDRQQEDTGALLFDADNDQDLDLYVVSGGSVAQADAPYYRDRLYLNTPQGFVKSTALPSVAVSGQAIAAADYDGDGDTDLFVGGRLKPGQYPYPASSLILRNEGGQNEQLRFSDVTTEVAPLLKDFGLVTTALWDDFNGDGQPDLVVAGEWMQIRFLQNENGTLRDVSDELIPGDTRGWWYALAAADVDGDGDQDYLAGNLGLNYKYKTSRENPFTVYAGDLDENGQTDIVLSYAKDGKQLPVRGRECSSQQMPVIQERFPTYEAFASATLEDIYGESQLDNALSYRIDTFASGWLEKTNDDFVWHPLPNAAQLSSINAIIPLPSGPTGDSQFLAAGNLYTSEVETPRNDAGYGLVLQYDTGELASLSASQTGLYVRGEAKVVMPIQLADEQQAYLFAINNDSLRLLKYQPQKYAEPLP